MLRTSIAIAAIAVATPGFAQVRSVADYDIAGVKLGASAAEARAALAKAGYRITNTGTVLSLEQDVAQQAARRLGKSVPWPNAGGTSVLMATGPHREYVEVKFAQRPGASRVSSISVRVPKETMTIEAFKAQLVDKYGEPQARRAGGLELTWCSPQVARVCGFAFVPSGPRDDSQPRLSARVSENWLWLQVGSETEQLFAREKEAAIERLAPKAGKAAF